MNSALISSHHLAHQAVIYIRQSTPHQVLSNQESLKLQYALKERALSLGWHADDIEIIDSDLGLSGAASFEREGFKDLLSKVALGQVGMILSSEVTRLSRNCSDWYPLLDICAYKNCLIADSDGIYDPASPNGRLLLGLKGTLSELELHTIRARMTAGLLHKAERGELALSLPTGLIRDALGRVQKDPDQEVQTRLELIFSSFLRLGSASKVLRFFNGQDLLVPRRDRFGDIVWKKPTVSSILFILKNPAYAGAFVYGRSRTTRHAPLAGQQLISIKRLPMEEWKIRLNDKYPKYIDWPTFERIQVMLKDNYAEYARNKTRGIPRAGKALFHGIVYCGECGHKMVIQYKGAARYICNYLRQQHATPVCQYLPADPIDELVVKAFFEALAPIELDAYQEALNSQADVQMKLDQAKEQELQRLHYQAELAKRQFTKVDPDNRLVAAELEKRWEEALRELKIAEDQPLQNLQLEAQQLNLTKEQVEIFKSICLQLPKIWDKDILKQEQRKALLRCLIDKLVLKRLAPDSVEARIIWRGGESTSLTVPTTVAAFADLSFAKAMEEAIVKFFHEGCSDELIAQKLTQKGYHSPLNNKVLVSTVKSIRLKHGLMRKASQSHPFKRKGFLSITQLAKKLEVSTYWFYDRINNGSILIDKQPGKYAFIFPDDPHTLRQLQQLKEGSLLKVDLRKGHQDA